MPLVPTFAVDADELFTRINVWDHKCTAPSWHKCSHPRGAVTRFARRLGRGRHTRQSLWNFRTPGKRISLEFATQIAGVLGVPVSTFTTLPETAAAAETPQPEIKAEAA